MASIGISSWVIDSYKSTEFYGILYQQSQLLLPGSLLLLIIQKALIVFSICSNDENNYFKCFNIILIIAENIVFLYWLVISIVPPIDVINFLEFESSNLQIHLIGIIYLVLKMSFMYVTEFKE